MNRVVIITGSTRGIGFATAAQFLKHGDAVVLHCRHREHVRKSGQSLLSFAPSEKILALTGDVRDEKDVEKIVKRSLETFGRIDILINNAGIAAYKPIERTSAREWDDILNTNLKGPFLFSRRVVPVMRNQGGGTIINISSALGVAGEANFSAYCASKFGLIGLTGVLADETAATGIRVYAVLPWAVDTSLVADTDLEIPPSELLKPEYVAKRIFETAAGKRKSGALIKVYS